MYKPDDYTQPRHKYKNKGVYFTTVNGTLPMNGYLIGVVYMNQNGDFIHMTNLHKVNDYKKYVINSSAVFNNGAGMNVMIYTTYPQADLNRYGWGDVTIKWSPDYIPESGVTTLNLN